MRLGIVTAILFLIGQAFANLDNGFIITEEEDRDELYQYTLPGPSEVVPYNATEEVIPYSKDRGYYRTLGCGDQIDVVSQNCPNYFPVSDREEWNFLVQPNVLFYMHCDYFHVPSRYNYVKVRVRNLFSQIISEATADSGYYPTTKTFRRGETVSAPTFIEMKLFGSRYSWRRGRGFRCVAIGKCEDGGATDSPPVSTEAPAVSTDAPAVSTDAPEASTDAPAVSTDAPAVSTDAPAPSTDAPVASTDAPEELTCGVCGNTRIIDGSPTTDNTYCFQVQLLIVNDANQGFRCGGTLIDPTTVLTAAHCVDDSDITRVQVGYGCGGGTCAATTNAASWVVHPNWRDDNQQLCSNGNDVAILRLNEPVPISDTTNFACLPDTCLASSGQRASTVGWGFTEEDDTSDILKEAGVITTDCDCDDTVICTVDDPSSPVQGRTCSGDSGGYMGIQENGRYVVHGVTSYGPENCKEEGNEGFAQVCNLMDFIQDNAGDGIQIA